MAKPSKTEEALERYGRDISGPLCKIVFLCFWWYCTSEYGFLFGFGLGWLPSGILAVAAAAVAYAGGALTAVIFGLAVLYGIASLLAIFGLI